MVETTGGFTSAGLALEAKTLELPSLSQKEAIEIGEIALDFGFERSVPIAVEVRLKEWVVFSHPCQVRLQIMIHGSRAKRALC